MTPSENPKVFIIMGPPGSGKGTQAELLAERFSLHHLEMSKIIEKNLAKAKDGDFVVVKNKKYFLSEEKKLRENGKLMSPPLISFWLISEVRKLAKEWLGIVTDGNPRTVYEGKEIIPFIKKVYGPKNIKIFLFEVSAKESIFRNSHRRICQLMRHPVLYAKETAKLKKCPLDGSDLLSRVDDTTEIIKIRLKEYKERTFPLVKLFKKQGLKINKINGEQSVADVFNDIVRILK